MYLIIGLGNPGEKYKNTRHNMGFEIISDFIPDLIGDQISDFSNWKINKKLKAEIATGEIDGKKIILAKPQTFMNESGNAVRALIDFYKIELKNLIIVHDDLDLPLGTIRISFGASSGGHKGVQSCIEALGTKEFWRVRIGVAGETRAKTAADVYVLKQFAKSEQPLADAAIKKAAELLREMLLHEPAVKTVRLLDPAAVCQ